MTRFEELTDIITNNKNKHKKKEEDILEVSGALLKGKLKIFYKFLNNARPMDYILHL